MRSILLHKHDAHLFGPREGRRWRIMLRVRAHASEGQTMKRVVVVIGGLGGYEINLLLFVPLYVLWSNT